LFFFELEPTYI